MMFATDSQSDDAEPTEMSNSNGLPSGSVRFPSAPSGYPASSSSAFAPATSRVVHSQLSTTSALRHVS